MICTQYDTDRWIRNSWWINIPCHMNGWAWQIGPSATHVCKPETWQGLFQLNLGFIPISLLDSSINGNLACWGMSQFQKMSSKNREGLQRRGKRYKCSTPSWQNLNKAGKEKHHSKTQFLRVYSHYFRQINTIRKHILLKDDVTWSRLKILHWIPASYKLAS